MYEVVACHASRHPEMFQEILDFDRQNMSDVLGKAGQGFPEEKRRKGLLGPSTRLILVRDGHRLVGYAEYCEDWSDSRNLYCSSMQIAQSHQGTMVFSRLMKVLLREWELKKFEFITTNVHASNLRMMSLLRKIGVAVESGVSASATVPAKADQKILANLRSRLMRKGVGEMPNE